MGQTSDFFLKKLDRLDRLPGSDLDHIHLSVTIHCVSK